MPLRSWSSAVRCFRHAVYLQIQISHPLLNWLAEDSTYARLRLRHWKPQGLCCHVMSWSNHSDVEPGGCEGAAAGGAGSFWVHVRRLKSLNPERTGFSDAAGISNHSNRFFDWLDQAKAEERGIEKYHCSGRRCDNLRLLLDVILEFGKVGKILF